MFFSSLPDVLPLDLNHVILFSSALTGVHLVDVSYLKAYYF